MVFEIPARNDIEYVAEQTYGFITTGIGARLESKYRTSLM